MLSFADRLNAIAAERRAKSGRVATEAKREYKVAAWAGTEGALKGKIVWGRCVTLDQLIAWGCDAQKLYDSLDVAATDKSWPGLVDLIREELKLPPRAPAATEAPQVDASSLSAAIAALPESERAALLAALGAGKAGKSKAKA